MLARLAFGFLALASVLLGVVADPQTFCDPVTVDLFSVTAIGGADAEGSELATATGTYDQIVYYVPLAQNYTGPDVFFNIILTPNQTAANFPTLQTYGFTISLNGQFKENPSGTGTFFDVGVSGDVTSIEFNNWLSFRTAVNNTLILNVTELYLVGPQGNLSHLTGCSYQYEFILNNPQYNPGTGANIVGDPQFKGLRGQSFQVHGVDGAVYNLISDANQQLNTRFTFLEGPRPCPVMPSTGKQSAACWSHPGSYLSELGLKTSGGSQLLISSGEASQGFASVQLNGKALAVGSTTELSFSDNEQSGSVTVMNSHELSIKSGLYELVVENNDGFVNLRSVYVSAANWPKLASHGLLGQTWQNKRWGGKIKEIEGDVDDYLIEDDNLFGDNFLDNQF